MGFNLVDDCNRIGAVMYCIYKIVMYMCNINRSIYIMCHVIYMYLACYA